MFTQAKNNRKKKAAIFINSKIEEYTVDDELTNEYTVVAILKNLVIISMYFNWKEDSGQDRNVEDDLNEFSDILIKYNKLPVLILTDSNSHNTYWGSRESNARGLKLNELIIEHNLELLNKTEYGPTFTKMVVEQNQESPSLRSSHIDLSLINCNFNQTSFEWKLLSFLSTEHKTIEIRIKSELFNKTYLKRTSINYNKTNWSEYLKTYNQHKPQINKINFNKTNFENLFYQFVKALKIASKCLIINKQKIFIDNPWYNGGLDLIKKKISKLRRIQ